MKMKELTYLEAIKEALDEEMQIDEKVFLIGEDIGIYGGAFGVTKGLIDKFGKKRVINTPMSEAAITGLSVGAAMEGLRPVLEIMFMDFITLCMDALVNHAAKISYISNGQFKVPLVIRTPAGAGRGYGATHSQSLDSWFMNIPGIKVVAPSNAMDAKGLLKSAIRDNNPIIFIENKLLYSKKGEIPEMKYTIPIGVADVKKKGRNLTLITYSRMVDLCLDVADELKERLDIEVIDLRSLVPLDITTIINSIKKTKKAIIIEEGPITGGIGAEISAQIANKGFHYLEKPIKRIGSEDLPIPCSPILENAMLPSKEKIKNEIKKLVYG